MKLGRGDLFGILIPGAFLVIVGAVLFAPELVFATGLSPGSLTGSEGVVVSLLALVASYVAGYGLRLLPPELVDRRSKRQFPYFKSVYAWHLKRSLPRTVRTAIKQYLADEYGEHYKDELSKANVGKAFLNNAKLQVYHRSEALRAEILYCESVARLAIGMCQALWIAVCLHVARVAASIAEISTGRPAGLKGMVDSPEMIVCGLATLCCCLALAPIFFLRVREARYKEIATVLYSLGTLLLDDQKERTHGPKQPPHRLLQTRGRRLSHALGAGSRIRTAPTRV